MNNETTPASRTTRARAALGTDYGRPIWFVNVFTGQIEPLGVREEFRKLGLGRAILSEAVRRLTGLGAAHIDVEPDSYRNAAFELYEAVGFRVIQDVLVYRKDYLLQR